MKLEELQVYQKAMDIADKVWNIVLKWNYFEKDTMGKQLVRAIDSVVANLSEGFGRFHYKETKNFTYYSRGSLFETKTWLNKAKKRGLISEDDFIHFSNEINVIGKMINNYIKSIGKYESGTISKLKEPPEPYDLPNNQFTND